jgi:hypothetical protein
MGIVSKIRERWAEVRHHAEDVYAEANGDVKLAKKLFRDRIQSYGLDPATIFVLIQIAIRLWAWAKENGYLSIPRNAPGFDFANSMGLDDED